MFITSFEEQNITYRSCSNLRIHLLKLVVADLPTTHVLLNTDDTITSSILNLVNNLLIDLLATMARLDNEKRIERIKQGLERSGYKPSGKKANTEKHERIKQLNKKGLTKEEIANAVSCGIATVYRVLKNDKIVSITKI